MLPLPNAAVPGLRDVQSLGAVKLHVRFPYRGPVPDSAPSPVCPFFLEAEKQMKERAHRGAGTKFPKTAYVGLCQTIKWEIPKENSFHDAP
jgi:hypothetical protein